MEQQFTYEVLEKLKRKKRKKIWKRILSVLMCVVVFCATYMLILPAITKENKPFCGLEEHIHEAGCYREVLVCQVHVHTDACYEAESTLICTRSTEGHIHSDACIKKTENILICTTEETGEHTHTDACYSVSTVYGCGQEEASAHVHDGSCYSAPQQICTVATEADHIHTETCNGREMICGQAEHTHVLQCYSDPHADVENASQWERTLKGVELTGLYREDLLEIARSQLGYQESKRNLHIGCIVRTKFRGNWLWEDCVVA